MRPVVIALVFGACIGKNKYPSHIRNRRMAMLPIELESHLDMKGYSLVEHEKYGSVIIANGGKVKQTCPLDRIDGAFKLFANVRTAQGLLKFVQAYGFLHKHSYKAGWMSAALEQGAT